MFGKFFKWFGDRTYYKRRAARLEKLHAELKKTYDELAVNAKDLLKLYEELEEEKRGLEDSVCVWKDMWYHERNKNKSSKVGEFKELHAKIQQLENELRAARRSSANNSNQVFTQDEIRSMIRLCHPDKHGGKEVATKVTQKLMSMRQR